MSAGLKVLALVFLAAVLFGGETAAQGTAALGPLDRLAKLEAEYADVEGRLKNQEFEAFRVMGQDFGGQTVRRDLRLLTETMAVLRRRLETLGAELAALRGVEFPDLQTVEITRLVVALDTEGVNHHGHVRADDEPILFVYYALNRPVETVDITLSLINAETGDNIKTERFSRTPRPGAGLRLGLPVDAGMLATGLSWRFEARLETSDGVTADGAVPFKVAAPVELERVWIARAPGETGGIDTLYTGQSAFLYASYYKDPDIGQISVRFRASTGDGVVLTDSEYRHPSSPDSVSEKRTAIELTAADLPSEGTVDVVVSVTGPDGVIDSKSTKFSIRTPRIRLIATSAIGAGRDGEFNILLPGGLPAPSSVTIEANGLSISRSGETATSGSFAAVSGYNGQEFLLTASVRFDDGLTLTDSRTVTFTGTAVGEQR